jgi:hypothetical protein
MVEPTSPPSNFDLRFGSFLVYSPRGTSTVSKQSRAVCYRVKQDTGGAIAQHLETLDLETLLVNPTRITIVDDVLTRGRMIMAVAIMLARRFPGVPLRAFALIRTMGLQLDVDRIIAPCVGVIRRQWHDADRQDDVPEPPLTLF